MKAWRLVADIGGSNARFARSERDGAVHDVRSYSVPDYPSFEATLSTYLAHCGGLDDCSSVAVAAAGPLVNGAINLTNGDWRIDYRDLTVRFGNVPVQLMNDLVAVAQSLPHLGADAVIPIGDNAMGRVSCASKLAINIGTGFGAAALVNINSRLHPLSSEAGHMSLPAFDGADQDLLRNAEPPFQSVEDVLSGPGLAHLCHALRSPNRRIPDALEASEVFERLERDPYARQAVRMFTRLLGRIVGDLVLAHCAWNGAYLCGSVARAWREICDVRLFREAMTAKGKMSDIMKSVPTFCISRDDAALIGLAFCE